MNIIIALAYTVSLLLLSPWIQISSLQAMLPRRPMHISCKGRERERERKRERERENRHTVTREY